MAHKHLVGHSQRLAGVARGRAGQGRAAPQVSAPPRRPFDMEGAEAGPPLTLHKKPGNPSSSPPHFVAPLRP